MQPNSNLVFEPRALLGFAKKVREIDKTNIECSRSVMLREAAFLKN